MLKVIGAGFGRTGTHSLGSAFEKLGYGPCYNLLEVTGQTDQTEVWKDAMDGKSVDWDQIFASYNSAVEWPTIAFLPEILEHYPEAKIILTLRDPESWFESANTTIFDALELSAHNPYPGQRESGEMKRRLILERTFSGRHREKEYSLEVYRRHQQHVIDLVPPERLLQFHIKDGWEPLCEFLEQPAPEEPFPRLNAKTEFLDSAPDWAKKIKHKKK